MAYEKQKLIGCGAALALALFGSVSTCSGYREAQRKLEANPDYVTACTLEDAAEDADNAEGKLEYHAAWVQMIPHTHHVGKSSYTTFTYIYHPARYPDAADARAFISQGVSRLEKYSEEDSRLQPLIDELRALYRQLPNMNNIDADNSRFSSERGHLESLEGRIESISNAFMDKVPKELRTSKKWNIAGFILSIAAGLAALGFGGYTIYRIREEQRYRY